MQLTILHILSLSPTNISYPPLIPQLSLYPLLLFLYAQSKQYLGYVGLGVNSSIGVQAGKWFIYIFLKVFSSFLALTNKRKNGKKKIPIFLSSYSLSLSLKILIPVYNQCPTKTKPSQYYFQFLFSEWNSSSTLWISDHDILSKVHEFHRPCASSSGLSNTILLEFKDIEPSIPCVSHRGHHVLCRKINIPG